MGREEFLEDSYAHPKRRVCHQRNAVLRTCLRDPILQRVPRPETQLHLHRLDLRNAGRLADSSRRDLGKRDAPQHTPFNILPQDPEGLGQRRLGIPPRALKQVYLLRAAQLREDIIHRPAHHGRRPVRPRLARRQVHAALDAHDDLVRVCRVLGEVAAHQRHRVGSLRAVELAAVPEGAAGGDGGLHGGEGLRLGRDSSDARGEAWGVVSLEFRFGKWDRWGVYVPMRP